MLDSQLRSRREETSEHSRSAGAPVQTKAKQFDGRILLVEDNPVNLELISRMLARLGLRIEVATDGAAAVDRAAMERFDLILMDCEMPLLDGFAATGRIRAGEAATGRARAPIIALTAHAATDACARCVAAGMDGVLSKPISRRELTEGLAMWLPMKEPAATGRPAIDATAIDGICGLGRDGASILLHVVSQFEQIAPELAGGIRASAQSGDAGAVARAAHSLRSSAGALGATAVAARCGEIEGQARSSMTIPDTAALDGLEAAIATAIRDLRTIAEGAA